MNKVLLLSIALQVPLTGLNAVPVLTQSQMIGMLQN